MINCPNCGTQNDSAARFCSECGADLRSLRSASPQSPTPQSSGPVPTFGESQSQSSTGGWNPSAYPVEPPKKGRRVWLWIVIGVLAFCLVSCCGFAIWANTSGESTVNGWLTQVADELTQVAPTQTPHR